MISITGSNASNSESNTTGKESVTECYSRLELLIYRYIIKIDSKSVSNLVERFIRISVYQLISN